MLSFFTLVLFCQISVCGSCFWLCIRGLLLLPHSHTTSTHTTHTHAPA